MSEAIDAEVNVKSSNIEKSRYPNVGEIVKLALAALITAGIFEYTDRHEWLDAMYQSMEESYGCSRETSRTIMHIEEVVTLTVAGAIGLIMMRKDEAARAERKRAKEATTTS